MATTLSITELRKLSLGDLLRELKSQSALIAKMCMGIKMNKEKDSARYKREKKQRARIHTVVHEKLKERDVETSSTPAS